MGGGERGHMWGLVFQRESEAGCQATPPNGRRGSREQGKGTSGRAPQWVIRWAVWCASKRGEWGFS